MCVSARAGGAADNYLLLGADADDFGNAVFTMGDSTSNGSGTAATTVNAPWGSNYRTGTSWPFPAIKEGLGTGGSGADDETLATALTAQMRALKNSRGWIGGNSSCNGQTVPGISPGGGCSAYADAWGVSGMADDAADARAAATLPYRVAGVAMSIGHNDDDGGLCGAYSANLSSLQSSIETAAQGFTGQTYGVPMFHSQLASYQMGGVADLDGDCATPLVSLATDDPTDHVLCTQKAHLGDTATTIYQGDGIHPTATGMQLLGEQMGLCMHAVLNSGARWSPLVPASVTLTAPTTIDVDYTGKIPCLMLNSTNTGTTTGCDAADCCTADPLVFETSDVDTPWTGTVIATPKYGFELQCSGRQPPIITSVAISNSTHVVITTDTSVQTSCTLLYGLSAQAGSLAGNGTASTGFGSPRGLLRDSMGVVGRVTGQVLPTYGAFWSQSVSGGVSPPATVATLFNDRRWSYGWLPRAGTPAAGSSFVPIFGSSASYTLPYVNGSWTESTTQAMPASAIGSTTVYFNPSDVTPQYWQSSGSGQTQYDIPDDLWFRWAGYASRHLVLNQYLTYWRGDAGTTTNEFYVQIVAANGNLVVGHHGSSGGGSDATITRAGLWPAVSQYSLLDVYVRRRGGTNDTCRIVVCLNGDCLNSAVGGACGGLESGDLTINAAFNGTADYLYPSFGWVFAVGEMANGQILDPNTSMNAIHDADFATYCPSPPCL